MTTSDCTFPRFTIVTPNWNGCPYLESCLNSVLDQDYPALEYIVVDGASTDGSGQVIEQCRTSLAGFICEPDTGHADALNKGFAISTGEFMGWINSDDILHPWTLRFVAQLFLTRPDVDWITGRPTSMNENGEIEWLGPIRPWSRLRFLAGDCEWIQQESTFWRRRLWEAAGGRLDTAYDLANDFELWTRFYHHAELHTVDWPLGCFRVRQGQRSVKYRARYVREAKAILQAELDGLDTEFRAAFTDLLPRQARLLSPEEKLGMEARLSACDPPIIRARTEWQAARQGSRKKPAASTIAAALSRAGTPSDIDALRGAQAGNRCFVLPPGDTGDVDLSPLRGELTISGPGVLLGHDGVAPKPTYILAGDDASLLDRAAALDAALSASPETLAFLPTWIKTSEGCRVATRALLPESGSRVYLQLGGAFPLEDDPCATLVRLAEFLGCDDILLTRPPERYQQSGELWSDLRRTLGNRGVRLRLAAFPTAETLPESPLEIVPLETLFDSEEIARRRAQAAANRTPRTKRIGERFSEWFAQSGARTGRTLLSAWRNRRFLGGFAALCGIVTLAVVLAPTIGARALILAIAGPSAAFILTLAVALKTRRIFFQLSEQVAELQKREAAREMRLIWMEIQTEHYKTQRRSMDNADSLH